MIIGARFGTSAEYDAYLAAFRVPDMIFYLVAGGALGSAFIPVFTGCLTRRQLTGAWRLFSAVSNLVVIIMTAAAVVAALLAPWLVRTILAPGFAPWQQALTVELMRWMLISTVIFGVSGIIMGVLNSFQHFLLPALAPILYNLSIIFAAWFLAPMYGVYGLAIGVIVGAGLHLDIQLFGLWRYKARYYRILGLRNPNVREVGRLMAPRVLGTGGGADQLLDQHTPGFNPGYRQPLGIELCLAADAAAPGYHRPGGCDGGLPHFRGFGGSRPAQRIALGNRQHPARVLFLAIPAAVGLLVWRVPLVRLLLERGEFNARSTALTAAALAFYSIGLIGHSAIEILARAYYALHDTRTPVIVGIAAMALNVALSLWLRVPMAIAGLALANTIATTLEMILLALLLSRRLGGLGWPQLIATVLKSGAAALLMAVPLWWAVNNLSDAPILLLAPAGLVVGGLVYLGAAALLRMPELQTVRRLIPGRR